MLPLFCFSTLCACNNSSSESSINTNISVSEQVELKNVYQIGVRENTYYYGWGIDDTSGSLVIVDMLKKDNNWFLVIPYGKYEIITIVYGYSTSIDRGVLYEYSDFYILKVGRV